MVNDSHNVEGHQCHQQFGDPAVDNARRIDGEVVRQRSGTARENHLRQSRLQCCSGTAGGHEKDHQIQARMRTFSQQVQCVAACRGRLRVTCAQANDQARQHQGTNGKSDDHVTPQGVKFVGRRVGYFLQYEGTRTERKHDEQSQ